MTMPVPSASESGTLRRGFFTSPAVKVMLFQASAENSEPTWATPKAISRPKAPAAAETVGKQAAQKIGARLDRPSAARRPEIGEVGADGGGVAADEDAEDDQRRRAPASWRR